MNIDWTKPIQTRDGRKARLLGVLTREGDNYTHVVATANAEGHESVTAYMSDGAFTNEGETCGDIINTPTTYYVNVYKVDNKSYYYTGQVELSKQYLAIEEADHNLVKTLTFTLP